MASRARPQCAVRHGINRWRTGSAAVLCFQCSSHLSTQHSSVCKEKIKRRSSTSFSQSHVNQTQMRVRRGTDFSSIARRLLLGRDRTSNPQPFTSIGTERETNRNSGPEVKVDVAEFAEVKTDVDEVAHRVLLTPEHCANSAVPSCSFVDACEIKAESDDDPQVKLRNDETVHLVPVTRKRCYTPTVPSCSIADARDVKPETDHGPEVKLLNGENKGTVHLAVTSVCGKVLGSLTVGDTADTPPVLTREDGIDSEVPSCSFPDAHEIKSETDNGPGMKLHDDEMNAMDLILNRKSSSPHDKMMEDLEHSCNLCDCLQSMSFERLRAPLAKPHPGRKTSRVGRYDTDAKAVVRNVQRFFATLKKELGPHYRQTVFRSVLKMTSLACGVSKGPIIRTLKEQRGPSPEEFKEKDQRDEIVHRYKTEWGAIVRQFVLSEIKVYTYVTVSELHEKLCYAFADFPLTLRQLYAFLRPLGFKFKRVGSGNCVFLNNGEEVRRISKNNCEDADDSELSSEQGEADEEEYSDYEMGVSEENVLLDNDATSKDTKDENKDVIHV